MDDLDFMSPSWNGTYYTHIGDSRCLQDLDRCERVARVRLFHFQGELNLVDTENPYSKVFRLYLCFSNRSAQGSIDA